MDRDGIFAGEDPFAIARAWLAEAAQAEPNDPDAVALATVDPEGMPNVRMVLLKMIEDDAFVFFTNYGSRKGQEIAATGKAAFCLHWKSLRRQIRVRGTTSREEGPAADAYFDSRALRSRIGALASRQSQPLASRAELEAEVARLGRDLGTHPRRPAFWGGIRIHPVEIEFWADGPFRLHDRFRWTRARPGGPWTIERLNP